MDNNSIKKEALAKRDNPFAGSKSWDGIFSYFGKKGLEKKSESYKEAVRIMTEIDENIRAAFKQQQQFAKMAYWANFKMDLSKFAHAVNDFFNAQVIISTLSTSELTRGNLTKLMAKVPYEVYQNSGWFGKLTADNVPEPNITYVDENFDANEFADKLNEINEEGQLKWIEYASKLMEKTKKNETETAATSAVQDVVKQTDDQPEESTPEESVPEVTPKTSPAPLPNTEIEQKTADYEYYEEMVKMGLFGNRHYQSLMRGKSLKKSMKTIFDLMQTTLDQSANALDNVSHSINVGDPDEYIKEITKLVKKSNYSITRIAPLWNEHFKGLVEATDEPELGVPSKPETSGETSGQEEAWTSGKEPRSEASKEEWDAYDAYVAQEPKKEWWETEELSPSHPNDPQNSIRDKDDVLYVWNPDENTYTWMGNYSPEKIKETEEIEESMKQWRARENQEAAKQWREGQEAELEEEEKRKQISTEAYWENMDDPLSSLSFARCTPQNQVNKLIEKGNYKAIANYIKKYANSIDDMDLKLKLIAIAEEADE